MNYEDFACKCGCKENKINPYVVDFVEWLEGKGYPVLISSAYRCENHNRKVGGVKGSAHEKGCAVDIVVKGSRHRFCLIGDALDYGIRRIGIGKTFIHFDIDTTKPKKVMFLYG